VNLIVLETMINSISFDTPIGAEYKRNNRSTRQKSLRCFPSCGLKGHVTGGFCGRPLKVVVELAREHNSLDLKIEDYRFVAEIRPQSQPGISRLKVITEEDLQRHLRGRFDKNEFNGEIFQADTANILSITPKMAEVELTFNSNHCSWDYSWKSNRWSGPQELHVVDIIVLRSTSANEVRVVSSAPSSPFMVSSSHKKPVKANRIKDDEDDEVDANASDVAGKKRRSRAARAEDRTHITRVTGNVPDSTMVSKIIPEDAAELRGSFAAPTRQLKVSQDGKSIAFSSEARSTEELVNEGALALIQLLGVTGAQTALSSSSSSSSAAAAAAAAGYYAAISGASKKAEKRTLSQADDTNNAGSSSSTSKKAHRVEAKELPPGYPYPPYPYAYPGYPPHGYPPMPYPYPYPYGMPPAGKDDTEEVKLPTKKRSKKDEASTGEGQDKAVAAQHSQYPAYPPSMYPPPHMFPYPPPPHMGGPGGSTPTYPAFAMYPYPPPPYAMPPATSTQKGAASSPAAHMHGAYPMPHFDPRNPYAAMGMPYPPMHPSMHMAYGAYPPHAYPGAPSKTDAAESTSTSDSEDADGDADKAATPVVTALVPACGSAEKVIPVAVAVGPSAAHVPSKLTNITLPKRGSGSAAAGEAPVIQEARPETRSSVYDILAKRARERENQHQDSSVTEDDAATLSTGGGS
jgi:hypothetical protein